MRHSRQAAASGRDAARARIGPARRAYAEKKRKSSIVLHGPHANLWPLNRSYSSSRIGKVAESNLTILNFFNSHINNSHDLFPNL